MTALQTRPVDRAAAVPVATPALYDVRIAHTRTAPLRNSFAYGGYLWLVDLDDVAAGRLVQGRPLPRWLRSQARFDAADHLGDPAASIKDNVVALAREHGIDDVDRVLMLASARSGAGRASYVFNPLSTHWCYRADGSLACLVAEVHNTYGEPARLPPASRRGRPGGGGQGVLRLPVLRRRRPLPDAVLRSGPAPADHHGAPAGRRDAVHRQCPRHRPPGDATHRAAGRPPVPDDGVACERADPPARSEAVVAPTARRPSSREPRRDDRPATARRRAARGSPCRARMRRTGRDSRRRRACPCTRAIAEALFRRAVAPLPVRVVFPDGRVLGAGGKHAPVMQLVRPANVFARLGADVKIGFGEAYMTGDWTTGPGTDLADLLAPFASRMSSLVHPLLQRLRHVVERTQPAHEENSPENSRDQHLPALRPVQRAVRAVPGRDDDLLVGLVRARRQPGRRPAPQDGRRPRPRPRRAGHARAGDRFRLGRPGDPGGPRARRPGHHADALHRAAGARPAAGRRGRRGPPRRRPAAGLPRRDRAVRRDRLAWR